ncbi:MAG: cytochrome-c peroxidase [Nitrospinota bacterium]|nr:cytochrome-c peroxidase [Nitrospinota bacterium]
MFLQKVLILVIGGLFLMASPTEVKKTEAGEAAGLGVLGPVPVPQNNLLTPAKIKLGKKLFFDDMLSGNGNLSCATCHDPGEGWTSHTRYSPAYPSISERRNSPSIINTAYNKVWIWDGRAGIRQNVFEGFWRGRSDNAGKCRKGTGKF